MRPLRVLFYFLLSLTLVTFLAMLYAAQLPNRYEVMRNGEFVYTETDYRGFPGLLSLTVLFGLGAIAAGINDKDPR